MSEEKPTFKVTDRRLFNPDGTPREGARREEPETTPADETTTTDAPPPVTATTKDAAQAVSEPPRASGGDAPSAATQEGPPEDEAAQDFMMAVEFIASFAAEGLGMSAHPEAAGQPPQVNLPLARQCIDMLGALERKTSGNLNDDEERFLKLILSQLRMQYVQLTQPRTPGGGPARGPRGFTGGDITGGR